MASDGITTAFGDRGITNLRDLLASGTLPALDSQLALSLLLNQLIVSTEKQLVAVESSLTEVALLLVRGDGDALVRVRAAKVIGHLVKVREGSERLGKLTKEGDGVFSLAEGASRDEDEGVRRACAGALVSYVEWGGREALVVLGSAPTALGDLADALLIGCGDDAMRVLAGACSIHEGNLATLSCPNALPNIATYLAGLGEGLPPVWGEGEGGEGGSGEGASPPFIPPPPHLQPPALPALRALRALSSLDRGKPAAFDAGAVPPIAAHLAHPHPMVRAAAAETMAVLSTHQNALQAFLDGPGGEGPGGIAASLMPLILQESTRVAGVVAIRACCDSVRGRGAILAEALGRGPQCMRVLCKGLKGALAKDLVDVIKTPTANAFMRESALAGLHEICSNGGASGIVSNTPGALEAIQATGESEEALVKDIRKALVSAVRE